MIVSGQRRGRTADLPIFGRPLGPWFQIVPEQKSIKNRIHLDVNASGGRGSSLDTRRERVEAEAARLVSLGATRLHTVVEEGLDHYAVALTDPEGNEFDIN
jgi:hypothetical protein